MAENVSLQVDLAPRAKRSLVLPNPVMVASGTFGYGVEYVKVFDIQRLGGIVTKTTTLAPRRGNPPVRIAETPAGLLNSIGLQNIGISALVRDLGPVYSTWTVPVVASIMGFTVGEYAEVASRLEGVEGFAGVELNLSCPNTERGGVEFGQDPEAAADVVVRVTRATTLPIIAKLTPNIADPRIVARAVVEAGADALCVGNTLQGMAIDLERRKPVIGATFAGLSGPALKPVAMRQVYVIAGASAVQIGTATFNNPLAPLQAIDGIAAYCREQEIFDIAELVGAGRAPADRRPKPEAVAVS